MSAASVVYACDEATRRCSRCNGREWLSDVKTSNRRLRSARRERHALDVLVLGTLFATLVLPAIVAAILQVIK